VKYKHLIDACSTPQQCIDLGNLIKLAGRGAERLSEPERSNTLSDLCQCAYLLGRHHGKLDPLAFLNPLAMPPNEELEG